MLNFTRDWTRNWLLEWDSGPLQTKRHTEICPRASRAHTGFRRSSLFCDTREVRCRFVGVGEKLLRRRELYYIQSARRRCIFRGYSEFASWKSHRERGRNAFRILRSILKFEVHGTYECSNDKFVQFAQKFHFINIRLLEEGRHWISSKKEKDFFSRIFKANFNDAQHTDRMNDRAPCFLSCVIYYIVIVWKRIRVYE